MENRIVWQHLKKQNTVKPFYNEHAYYELTLVVKWFSFPVGFITHCEVNGYNELQCT